MTITNQKTSLLVPHQLPEFVRDNPDYSNFVDFIRAYYEWLEQTNNVTDRTKNILNYSDIDKTSDEFLDYFVNDFLQYFPNDSLISKETAVKAAKQLYKSKGTPASYQFLFRILYNSDFDLFYTKDAVLKPSDGIWFVTKSLMLATADEKFLQTSNLRLYGNTSKSIATIEMAVLAGTKIEIFISNIERLFESGEFVTVVDGYDQPVLFDGQILTAKIVGQISQILIDPNNRGLTYAVNDPVIVYGGLSSNTGIGALASVGEITKGSVQSVTVNDGGFGFTMDSLISFGNLNEDAAMPMAEIGSLNPTFMPRAVIRSGGTGYLVNDPVYVSDNMVATVTSVNANGTIQKITYNPGIDGQIILGLSATVQSKNPLASNCIIRIADDMSSARANVSFISNNIISLSSQTQIGNSYYSFLHLHPSSNANTKLSDALSFISFPTYPIGSIIVTNGGGGLTQVPTVDAISTYEAELGTYEDLSFLGILAPIEILDGGEGYHVSDTVVISGGSGTGASATIDSVDANGTITSITYTSTGDYPAGGFGYRNDGLPAVTVRSSTATTNCILGIFGTLGTNDSLVASVDRAGSITSIKIRNYGEDYIEAPSVSIKVMDIVVNGLEPNNLPVRGDYIYQGDNISVAGFYSYFDSIKLLQENEISTETLYSIRIYDYSQAPDITQQLKSEREGIDEEYDIYFNIVDVTVPSNYYYNGSPKFINGLKQYGDGTAKATATFLNGLTVGSGQYLNSQGHLNAFSVLQNEIYNNYTYQITVQKELSKYKDILLNLLHPTGMRLLGRNALNSNKNFNTTVQESTTQGHTLYHYTNYVSSTAEMLTDFTNKSNNIVKFTNLGSGVNIANFIFANSIIQLSPTNGPSVKSTISSINYNSNTITLSSNTWLTYPNVAYGTVINGQDTINIGLITNSYNVINNGVYTDPYHPLKDIVFAGDQVKIGSQTRTVSYVDYDNDIIHVTSNFSSNVSNSFVSVKRTFSAGGTSGKVGQVVIYGAVGTQYVPELTTTDNQTLITEDGKIILLG